MGAYPLQIVAVLIPVLLTKADSHAKQLHHSMTPEEIKHYLETDSHDDIPEYKAITLSLPKRSTTGRVKLHSISAFGKKLHVELTTPSNIISDHGVIVQRHTEDGIKEQIFRPDGQLLHGHVIGDENSKVAVKVGNNGNEMSGSIFSDGHVYKIQPIKESLRRKANLHGNGHHVISRRKLKQSVFDNVKTSNVVRDAKRRTRRSNDVIDARIVELMITIDKPTFDFYGNGSMEYVLNVANMVGRLYQDPSMGFNLSVLLTKVFLIQHNEPALDIKANQIDSAVGYLSKFRQWALKQSSRDPPGATGHFDHGSLITRHICGLSHCALDGVAYSGYPCNKNLDFNINEARGLQAAFSVAHEMAHNIGLSHDKGDCDKGFIMSAGQTPGPNSFRWSPCSSKRMKEIMSTHTCYSDKPRKTFPMPAMLPGYLFDADKQCKMAYDDTYSICPVTKDSCAQLFCRKGYSCVGRGAAPLEGTPCGQRKWCLRGHCVDVGNDLPPAVDGQWGAWSHYTPCTRLCGGGVRRRKRYCDNPSPKYMGKDCEGESEGHEEICNPQECHPAFDSRKEQCIKNGVNDTYYASSHPCTLYCRKGNMVRRMGDVLDGTRCYKDQDKKDTCIQGRCRKVGCDNVLESGNELDRCRKCGGDGGDCKLVKVPNYTKDYRIYGLANPDLMFVIPTGATSVTIKELGKTNNFMSIKLQMSSSSPYIVTVPSYTDEFKAAGTIIEHYMKEVTDDETIFIRGPTTQPVYAVFVYIGYYKNPGFSCQYYLPGQGQPTKYVWKVVKGDYCDASCAGGIQINHVTCHRVDDDTFVDVKHCDQATKPAVRDSCNTQPCQPEWKTGDWNMCSKTCASGQQSRLVTCQQKTSKSTFKTLDDSACDLKTKPTLIQTCNNRDCPPVWAHSPWTKCSAECGGGSRSKTITCTQTLLNQTVITVDDSKCLTEIGYKPALSEPCNTMKCYLWTKEYPCNGCKGYKHLGCFHDTGTRALPILINAKLPSVNTITECHNAVQALGYTVFSVQNQKECWSSATGKQTYSMYGPSSSCKDGKGGSWANDVYQIEPEKRFEAIGCFKDNHVPDRRPLPSLVGNHRGNIDWQNINTTVERCSHDAWKNGMAVFGVQYYGECWSGKLGYKSYSIDGVSHNCWHTVGASGTNYVYAFSRKVVKTKMVCRHVITNVKVSDDHCTGTKDTNDLRLCSEVCNATS